MKTINNSNDWDDIAKEYHDRRQKGTTDLDISWWRAMPYEMIDKDLSGKKVLDVGCGTGITTKILAERGGDCTAFDSSDTMIDIAKEYDTKTNYLKCEEEIVDTHCLKLFKDEEFDLTTSFLTIPAIKSKLVVKDIFYEIHRSLKKGGSLVVSSVEAQSPYNFSAEFLDYTIPVYMHGLDFLFNMMSEIGFKLDKFENPIVLTELSKDDPEGWMGWFDPTPGLAASYYVMRFERL